MSWFPVCLIVGGRMASIEIELPLTLPTGFYILEVTGRRGWQAQAKVLIGTP
ncbi:MAG: hypothetical protein RQ993_01405 [Bacteroidota bacterium]|nr:hypothetical protein [Bacteroidota bacterium]